MNIGNDAYKFIDFGFAGLFCKGICFLMTETLQELQLQLSPDNF